MMSAKASRRRRLSAEARRMLSWCVALAVAVHMLLLAAMAPAPPKPRLDGGARRVAWRPARPISVRLVAQEPVPPIAAATPAYGASSVVSAPASAASTATTIALAAASSVPSAPASSASAVVTGAAPASAASGAMGDVGDTLDGSYVPRPQLSTAPEPAIPVVIAAPPASASAGRLIGRYSGVLALYIDEQGYVRRVEAEPPALPEPMERAARAAFLNARFSPGQVDGHAVKSRIRVEVVFDDGPAPAASAASGASGASAASAASAPRGASSAARAASAQRSP